MTNEFYKKNKIINVDFMSLGGISLKEIIFNSLDFIKKEKDCYKQSYYTPAQDNISRFI